MSVMPPLTVGGVFGGRYAITRVIKSGGMGAVYEVQDRTTQAIRALKVMHPDLVGDQELRARFEQEARITGGIRSQHIVETYDAGIEPETRTPYIVMELLRGEELGAALKERGGLPVADALRFLGHAARALDRTHEAGIIHRDLKPENLFLCEREDGPPSLKILDFGIAKVVAEGMTKTTKALGTPLYMPVEQMQGAKGVGPEADRYALAQIAYAMLTGEPYWREEAREYGVIALCLRVSQGIPEPPSARAKRRSAVTLPPSFDPWFEKATATDPAARFGSCSAMIDALAEAMGDAPVARGPTPPPSERLSTPLTLKAVEAGASASSRSGALERPPASEAAVPRRSALARLALPAGAVIAAVAITWLVMRQSGGDAARPPASAAPADTVAGAAATAPPREGIEVVPIGSTPSPAASGAIAGSVLSGNGAAASGTAPSSAPLASASSSAAGPRRPGGPRGAGTSAPQWSIY